MSHTDLAEILHMVQSFPITASRLLLYSSDSFAIKQQEVYERAKEGWYMSGSSYPCINILWSHCSLWQDIGYKLP